MESGILDQPPTKEHTNGNDIDRISALPDSVLHHILSFLTTKYTVQSSILSKRWRHLWASVTVLDFTDKSFIRNDNGRLNESDTHNFENFVDTVLLLRDASDLRSFSLCCSEYSDEGHLHRWIRHATKYNPKVLQIKLLGGYCQLPLSILPCQSLEELSINLPFTVKLGPPKVMGRLRRLRIKSVRCKHGFMDNLISSCPVLEDLDLHNCEIGALCISSNTLKRLRIELCRFSLDETLISIPSLVCLTYINNSSARTTLKNLSSLLNATVDTIDIISIDFIRGLANVETLNFSCSEDDQYCILPVELARGFPMFDNLRSLTLGGQCTSDDIQVVSCFLQHSPNLKTFTLNNREVSSPLSLSSWKVS